MGVIEEAKSIFANVQHKSDYEFAIQLNRWLLQPLGVWPLNLRNSKLERLLSKISVIYSGFFLLFLTVPGCLDILITKDLEARLKKIGPLSFIMINTIKYSLLIIHQEKISFCLKTVFEDWRDVKNQEDREIMIKSVHTARYFMILCVIFMFGGALPFCTIFPLLANSVYSENDTVRNLAFSGYFVVFDPQVKPFYEVVFFLQFVCTFAMCSLTCGTCSMIILFVIHICGQLQVVMILLNNLVQSNQNREFPTKNMSLQYIVERHLRSLRFAAQVQKIVNEICLVEFLGTTVNISFVGYHFIAELKRINVTGVIIYSMIFSSFLFNIFIFCYISEMLLAQCEEVGNVAYMIKWNYLSAKKARDLIPIIMISCRPAKLTASNMVSFSMRSFCSILKASAAYLNVIRTF